MNQNQEKLNIISDLIIFKSSLKSIIKTCGIHSTDSQIDFLSIDILKMMLGEKYFPILLKKINQVDFSN